MTSQRVERTWIRTGGYGRFRGEWVNILLRDMDSEGSLLLCKSLLAVNINGGN